ncbi:RNA polymerase sigma-70 factor, ECF subfamily [Chitinophaga costaii]|uniref:RNA polymerase sigma-70 factor, ECF subfamily n=1 Tax=Chitinophaga costaii TaxID=1335309 RepID=A0A1C4ENP2_9BACT|nr:sigma-70 family RNA polymerase sigma factor [Chitinophaga costaii]PUZ22473.1 sigma-70 family RNA polymerase sigma factor [Chitinophaga costaii]SCC45215.1 RNA polymerase sigma-70 factor, ECF subfamily [Chitinophaga costaii]
MQQAPAEHYTNLIAQHKGLIYKVANAYCQDAEHRKDLVQEILIQLWRAFPAYDPQYRVSTWMYRISLNVAISFYRKDNRHKSVSAPLPASILELEDEHPPPQQAALQQLQQFINELPELDRALMLLYLEEKTHTEMADILGISTTNVATKISRIKQKLKQRFSHH